jgi:hypothetical protein
MCDLKKYDDNLSEIYDKAEKLSKKLDFLNETDRGEAAVIVTECLKTIFKIILKQP